MNERDPELEKLYREHSREEPPPALDAAILAAAHRAVESGPRKVGAEATRPQRWWMPLAAAAAIGVVAIGVIQQVPKDTAFDSTSVATAPAPAPEPSREAAPPAAPPPPAATAPATPPAASVEPKQQVPADAGALSKKQKAAEAPAPRPAPPPPERARENKVAEPTPFPAAQPPQKTEPEADLAAKRDAPMEQSFADRRKDTSMREERQAAAPAGAGAAMAPPPAAAPAPAAPAPFPSRMRSQSETAAGTVAQSKPVDDEMRTLARDPDAWIVRIRKLRDEGNTAQALRELKEFRALVPDAERRLPADLKSLQP